MINPYFQNKNIILYCGDSFEVLNLINITFDSIITDPPYAINFENQEWDRKNFSINLYSNVFYNKLKDTGNLLMFQGWSNVPETIMHFKQMFYLKNWIIYDRIKGRGAKRNFVSTRQDLLWFTKNEKQYVFNPQLSHIKKKTGGTIGKKNGCQYRKLTNVWTDISPIVPWSKQRVEHPTQKPIELLTRIIQIFTNQHDIILDPFAGSGTTGMACMNTNRKCILIQKQEKYCEIAAKRFENK